MTGYTPPKTEDVLRGISELNSLSQRYTEVANVGHILNYIRKVSTLLANIRTIIPTEAAITFATEIHSILNEDFLNWSRYSSLNNVNGLIL